MAEIEKEGGNEKRGKGVMQLSEYPSPNHSARPKGAVIDTVVIHYTDMITAEEALLCLADPNAEVSAHYLIDEEGHVYRLVPEDRAAWHAGRSAWRGRESINQTSIGIELANPGHRNGYQPFPLTQMAALVSLCREIIVRHKVPKRNIVGHSDIAPDRKRDPGELFDWRWLAKQGVGLFPKMEVAANDDMAKVIHAPGSRGEAVRDVQYSLQNYGYNLATNGEYDMHMEAVVLAFQRHFLPARMSGNWCYASKAMLAALTESITT